MRVCQLQTELPNPRRIPLESVLLHAWRWMQASQPDQAAFELVDSRRFRYNFDNGLTARAVTVYHRLARTGIPLYPSLKVATGCHRQGSQKRGSTALP